jgi:hypothetical protein
VPEVAAEEPHTQAERLELVVLAVEEMVLVQVGQEQRILVVAVAVVHTQLLAVLAALVLWSSDSHRRILTRSVLV